MSVYSEYNFIRVGNLSQCSQSPLLSGHSLKKTKGEGI